MTAYTHILMAPKTQKSDKGKDLRTIYEYIPNLPGFKPVLLLGQPWILRYGRGWQRQVPAQKPSVGSPHQCWFPRCRAAMWQGEAWLPRALTGQDLTHQHIQRPLATKSPFPEVYGGRHRKTVNLLKAKLTPRHVKAYMAS